MNKAILFLLVIGMSSCNQDDLIDVHNSTPIETSFDLSIKNINRVDLLDPESQGTYNTDSISIFEKVNIDGIEEYKRQLKFSNRFDIFQNAQGEYIMRVGSEYFLKDYNEERNMLIEWNSIDTDTIKLELSAYGNGGIMVKKVWYNQEVKWGLQSDNNDVAIDTLGNYRGINFFEIIKE